MSNLISAVISDETREAAKTKINEIKELLPFLQAMAVGNKKNRRRMGQKSVEFVNLGLLGAKNFGKYLPQAFEAEEYAKDVTLISQLWELRVPIAALLESVDDTIFAASVDAMKTTDSVYGYLKTAAKKDASVKKHVDEMKKKYERKAAAPKAKPADQAPQAASEPL
ncbi:MAG: hypothetical protein Q4G63_10115 [Bacteroidia bacterium]|nr:hypothetical protein [Bacteroidia bacterium]